MKKQKGMCGLRIHDIIVFARELLDKNYAENTRESIRKLSLKRLVNHGLLVLNPDNPKRPINSGSTNYALEPSFRKILEKEGNDDLIKKWKEGNKNLLKNLTERIEKHLEGMVAVNEAFKKEFGRTVVYFPNNRAIHSISDTSKKIGNKTFRAVHINNLLGDFIYIQEYEESAYGEEIKGGLTVGVNNVEEFISFLLDINKKFMEQIKDDKHS